MNSYDLTNDFVEEQGGQAVPVAQVMKAEVTERDKWAVSIQEELESRQALNMYVQLTPKEAYERYWGRKIPTKIMPAKLVLVKKVVHEETEMTEGQVPPCRPWKAKSRICCCGNFDDGTIGGDIENRSEEPVTFELRTLLGITAANPGWGIGALDIKTAFLHAPLDDEEDGIILVKPPALLAILGLILTEFIGN